MARGLQKVETQKRNTMSGIESRQRSGQNPLTDEQMKNSTGTKSQKFENIATFGLTQKFKNIATTEAAKNYNAFTNVPLSTTATSSYMQQMALRKSRQTSTRLGG